MAVTSVERYYSGVAIVLELALGTAVCCISGLVLTGYLKLHAWKKPSGLIVMNLLAADIINGVNAPLQAAYIHCLLRDINAPELFNTIFFLQALFIWVSLLIIILLNISRLISIVVPFRYTSVITLHTTRIALALFWVVGFINCVLKRYVLHRNMMFKFYVAGVLIQFIFNVIILGLAVYTLIVLKLSTAHQSNNTRVRATKTVVIVSLAYFLTYGYYIYVNIIWMIPGLPHSTTNQWIIFTAVGNWSLSIAHLFLLMNSLFNGIILGWQPNIRAAIQNIWIPDYIRHILQQNVKSGLHSKVDFGQVQKHFH